MQSQARGMSVSEGRVGWKENRLCVWCVRGGCWGVWVRVPVLVGGYGGAVEKMSLLARSAALAAPGAR